MGIIRHRTLYVSKITCVVEGVRKAMFISSESPNMEVTRLEAINNEFKNNINSSGGGVTFFGHDIKYVTYNGKRLRRGLPTIRGDTIYYSGVIIYDNGNHLRTHLNVHSSVKSCSCVCM